MPATSIPECSAPNAIISGQQIRRTPFDDRLTTDLREYKKRALNAASLRRALINATILYCFVCSEPLPNAG